jgi:hypothetical protein
MRIASALKTASMRLYIFDTIAEQLHSKAASGLSLSSNIFILSLILIYKKPG